MLLDHTSKNCWIWSCAMGGDSGIERHKLITESQMHQHVKPSASAAPWPSVTLSPCSSFLPIFCFELHDWWCIFLYRLCHCSKRKMCCSSRTWFLATSVLWLCFPIPFPSCECSDAGIGNWILIIVSMASRNVVGTCGGQCMYWLNEQEHRSRIVGLRSTQVDLLQKCSWVW
jgi:hypothetical protein